MLQKKGSHLAALFIYMLLSCLGVVSANEIEDVLSVHAEDAASTCAIAIEAKGGHASDNIAIAEEVGATGIAEASATR